MNSIKILLKICSPGIVYIYKKIIPFAIFLNKKNIKRAPCNSKLF